MDSRDLFEIVRDSLNEGYKEKMADGRVVLVDMDALGMKSRGFMVVNYKDLETHAVTVTEVPWTE